MAIAVAAAGWAADDSGGGTDVCFRWLLTMHCIASLPIPQFSVITYPSIAEQLLQVTGPISVPHTGELWRWVFDFFH